MDTLEKQIRTPNDEAKFIDATDRLFDFLPVAAVERSSARIIEVIMNGEASHHFAVLIFKKVLFVKDESIIIAFMPAFRLCVDFTKYHELNDTAIRALVI